MTNTKGPPEGTSASPWVRVALTLYGGVSAIAVLAWNAKRRFQVHYHYGADFLECLPPTGGRDNEVVFLQMFVFQGSQAALLFVTVVVLLFHLSNPRVAASLRTRWKLAIDIRTLWLLLAIVFVVVRGLGLFAGEEGLGGGPDAIDARRSAFCTMAEVKIVEGILGLGLAAVTAWMLRRR